MKTLFKAIVVVIAFLVAVTIFLLYQFFSVPSNVTAEIQSRACAGIIRSIEKTQPCFLTLHVAERNKTSDLSVMNCCVAEKNTFFDYAEVGDSLIKEKGKLSVLVIKANHNGKKEFKYPVCFQ